MEGSAAKDFKSLLEKTCAPAEAPAQHKKSSLLGLLGHRLLLDCLPDLQQDLNTTILMRKVKITWIAPLISLILFSVWYQVIPTLGAQSMPVHCLSNKDGNWGDGFFIHRKNEGGEILWCH